MTQTVTIEIPSDLFENLKLKADVLHRPVNELVAQTLAVTTLPVAELPFELTAELEAMVNFSDEALWAATKPAVSATERARLEQLNAMAGERKLSEAEQKEQGRLLTVWQRSIARAPAARRR